MKNLKFVGSDINISSASYPQDLLSFVDLTNLEDLSGEIWLMNAPKMDENSLELNDLVIRKKVLWGNNAELDLANESH